MTLKKIMMKAALAAIVLASGTALAADADFTADLSVSLAFRPNSTTEPAANIDQIKLNGTRRVRASLTTPAGTVANGVELDAVIPADLDVTAVSGCTPTAAAVAADSFFPCEVGTITDGAVANVDITLEQSLPDPLPATCDVTPVYDPVAVTVTTTSTDPVAANNAATITPVGVLWSFADLEVTFTGAAHSADGVDQTYAVTVTNHGPCVSSDVWLYSDAYGSAPFVSATWDAICQNAGDDFEADGCQLGDLAVGQVVEFDKVYHIPSMPSAANSLYHPLGVSLGGPVSALVTPDFSTGDNSAGLNTWVSQKGSGCSTAGAGGPTGLLALGALGLLFRRRRS